jgi:hypothetical protein
MDNRTKELWAVIDENSEIFWSRGGSSTRPHLMVYESQKAAEKACNNYWTKQVLMGETYGIKKIYSVEQKAR